MLEAEEQGGIPGFGRKQMSPSQGEDCREFIKGQTVHKGVGKSEGTSKECAAPRDE